MRKRLTYNDVIFDLMSSQDQCNARLLKAVQSKDLELARLALQRGADAAANNNGLLPLAAKKANLPMMRLLLDHGAKADNKALAAAVSSNSLEAVTLLFDHGATVGSNSAELIRTAIDLIFYLPNHAREMTDLLISKGADINADEGAVLTFNAGRAYNAVVLLLDLGADIKATNGKALAAAVKPGYSKLVQLLLDRGADPAAAGSLALKEAAANSRLEMLHLLTQKGGDNNAHPEHQKLYAEYCKALNNWHEIADIDPPPTLWKERPEYFHPAAYEAALKMLTKDETLLCPRNPQKMAFGISSLFETEQRMLQYLAKWGKFGKSPFTDLALEISAPPQPGVNVRAWGDAALKHGPTVARQFHQAHLKTPQNKPSVPKPRP